MGYMYNILEDKDYEIDTLQKDLECILRSIPSYIDIMLSQTMALAQAYKMGQSPKKITAKNIMTLMQFSQNLMQGGWINKDPYVQLPHFGEGEAKKAKTVMNGKNFFQYITLPKEERF